MPRTSLTRTLPDPHHVPGRPDWVQMNVMRHEDEFTLSVTGSYSTVLAQFPVRQEDGTLQLRTVNSHTTRHEPLGDTTPLGPCPSLQHVIGAVVLALTRSLDLEDDGGPGGALERLPMDPLF